jgi:hypothetical protein
MAPSIRTFLSVLLILLGTSLNEAFIPNLHVPPSVVPRASKFAARFLPARLGPLFSNSITEANDDVVPVAKGKLSRIQQAVLQGEWKDKLLKVSNYASALCVLDCTILPIVTIVLPLFGIVAASPVQMEWLHEFGHSVALYFVLPVGGLATTMNYLYSHRKLWIAALGWSGLALVLVSNAGCGLAHGMPGAVGSFLDHWLHVLHHGVTHRVVNLAGTFLLVSTVPKPTAYTNNTNRRIPNPTSTHTASLSLTLQLGSNYLSHRDGCAHGPSCDHDHGHSHD